MERDQKNEDFEIKFGLGDYRARFIKRETIIKRPKEIGALEYLLALEQQYEPREINELCHEQKWLLIEKWMDEGGKYDERPGEDDKAEDRKLFPDERWWRAIEAHNARRARARILYREHRMPIPEYLRHPLN